MLASLVAGLATTPYAAFHFHRVAPYGVLANLARDAGGLGLGDAGGHARRCWRCRSASTACSGG